MTTARVEFPRRQPNEGSPSAEWGPVRQDFHKRMNQMDRKIDKTKRKGLWGSIPTSVKVIGAGLLTALGLSYLYRSASTGHDRSMTDSENLRSDVNRSINNATPPTNLTQQGSALYRWFGNWGNNRSPGTAYNANEPSGGNNSGTGTPPGN